MSHVSMKAKKKANVKARRVVSGGRTKKKAVPRRGSKAGGGKKKGRGAWGVSGASRGNAARRVEGGTRGGSAQEKKTSAELRPGVTAGGAGEPEDRGAPPALPTPIATFNI